MNIPLYEYSLWTALPLMIFFGAYFLLARTPDKAIFDNYLRSRRIMGCALLLLAANYAVHLFIEVRLHDTDAAILMNLSTYFLCYWLFSSALTTLLDRFYVTRRRMATHLAQWLLFTLAAGIILKWLPEGTTQKIGLLAMAAWLVCYGLTLARRLIKAYRRAVRLFDDTLSDDIAAYIRWLSIFTYWAVIFGVGCGLLTFLPDRYIFLGTVVDTILRLSLLLLHELPAILRAGGACARGRRPDRTGRLRQCAGTVGRHADKYPYRHCHTA